jgi:hypothetical protein
VRAVSRTFFELVGALGAGRTIAFDECDAIARALASLYGTGEPPSIDFDGVPEGAPLVLGEQTRDDGARDVFWMRRPDATGVRTFLLERERGPRATTLLVPTARGLPRDWSTRWSASHVEIDVLTEVVVIRGGALALATRLRVVRATPEQAANIPLAAPVAPKLPIIVPRGRLR